MTPQQRKHLLDLYAGVRVADVRDGLDTLMYHDVGSMDVSIRPLFRTRAHGIARTVRYLPFRGGMPENKPEPAEYWDWVSTYYKTICPFPWMKEAEEGDFIVLDQGGVDGSLVGSDNSLKCMLRGAKGFVTNGGVRDTDEMIIQKVPCWSAYIGQAMVQRRLEFDAQNVAVCVGGVQVRPGDIIVADGDGVIAVPSEIAEEVGRYANEEHNRDIERRKKSYQKFGWKQDNTVT